MKVLIVSDYPYIIEKSGYATQILNLINKLIDFFPNNEYYFVPIGSKSKTVKLIDLKDIANTLDHKYKFYYEKVKLYNIIDRETLFQDLYQITTENNFDSNDIILFYCDLIIKNNLIKNNINCKKYLWFACHTSFNDNYNLINNKLAELAKKIDKSNLRFLPIMDKIATFSEFGVNVLKSINYESKFINHSINYNNFKKLDKKKLRKKFLINTDFFICLLIGRNNDLNDRKAFKENLEGFNLFVNTMKKDNIYLLLHPISYAKDINLNELSEALHIQDKIIRIPNECNKLDTEYINILYNISDVLLCNSKIEGFGLTSIEAQITGLPAIVTDCSAMPENLYQGIKTTPQIVTNKINNINSYSIPDPKEICKALINVYNKNYEKKEIPLNKYNIDYIFKDWVTFLELQNNNDLISLNNQSILFILLNKNNLMHNIKMIQNNYINYKIVIIKQYEDNIYDIIKSLNLLNIFFIDSKDYYFNVFYLIINYFPYTSYYFIINNIKLNNNNINIISNNFYFTYDNTKLELNSNDIKLISHNYKQKDIIFYNNKNINYFTNNLLLSYTNFVNLLNTFKNIKIENFMLFNISLSIFLNNQKNYNLINL